MSVGNKIKTIRKEAKMSQEELALNLNNKYGTKIVKSMISKWENDKEEPRMEFVRNIANFFSVSLDYMLGLSDTPTTNSKIIINDDPKLKELIKIASDLSAEDLNTLINIAKRFNS
ncbi:MAG: helix-turn-helix domain-containing protein [Vallitalea sp.]|jgi:repressor LexA|nr:helix-turn-helix domain-containing protein [Vallitalea sp.]